MVIEDFPFVNIHKKSNRTMVILEDSTVDGLPAVDVERLDGDYVYGIHKRLYDLLSVDFDLVIMNKTIKCKRR
jgi:hypothetical protein